jgi:hypothetical protein
MSCPLKVGDFALAPQDAQKAMIFTPEFNPMGMPRAGGTGGGRQGRQGTTFFEASEYPGPWGLHLLDFRRRASTFASTLADGKWLRIQSRGHALLEGWHG